MHDEHRSSGRSVWVCRCGSPGDDGLSRSRGRCGRWPQDRPILLQPLPCGRTTEAKGMDQRTIFCRNSQQAHDHDGIVGGHHPNRASKMSPGAQRSPSEAADLAAYILTLKQQKSGACLGKAAATAIEADRFRRCGISHFQPIRADRGMIGSCDWQSATAKLWQRPGVSL